MKVAVCVKWVRDPDSPVGFGTNAGGDENSATPNQMVSPIDLVAVELAVRMAEQAKAEVTAYTFGDSRSEGALRAALAIGVNRAVRVEQGSLNDRDALIVALALADVIAQAGADIVLCGERSPDLGTAFVPTAMAAALRANVVRSVIAVEKFGDSRVVLRQKMFRGGQRIVESSLPVVAGVLQGAAEPRYPSTRARMLAGRATIEAITPRGAAAVSGLVISAIRPPRPASVFGPDPSLPAKERYRIVLSAGVEQRASRRIEGEVVQVAARMLELLGKSASPSA